MNRDELLTKLAMELSKWPKGYVNILQISNDWAWSDDDDGMYLDGYNGSFVIEEKDWLAERERLINKPSWADAPDWAQWLTQQRNGLWFWSQRKPCMMDAGIWRSVGKSITRSPVFGAIPAGHRWQDTLEQRPAEEWPEERADVLGQNGNDGNHYHKQARYQDQQGDDWIDECARTMTPEQFRGAMIFTVGKYLRRLGKKDAIESEVGKIADYAQRWHEYEKTNTEHSA